jgi:hypothetical protein
MMPDNRCIISKVRTEIVYTPWQGSSNDDPRTKLIWPTDKEKNKSLMKYIDFQRQKQGRILRGGVSSPPGDIFLQPKSIIHIHSSIKHF